MEKFDYIITGGGAAGLSLLVNMIRSGKFSRQKILLIDKAPKTQNDRTWCFWEKDEGPFEEIVCYKWDRLWFHGKGYSQLKDIRPYRYKMIRGIDFYRHCYGIIGQHENIKVQYGEVESLHSSSEGTYVIVGGEKMTAHYIFNSILPSMLAPGTSTPASFPQQGAAVLSLPGARWNLLQHFKGWTIGTSHPVFNPEEAILMDFRTRQERGTAFVYTMPFSPTSALVEYTLFSEKLSAPHEYEEGLKEYIRDILKIDEYQVSSQEFGIIPMTDHRFPLRHHNIIYMGTAGGQTKASSGYTFQFIQQHAKEIVRSLIQTGKPLTQRPGWRYRFYDSVLLNVLASGKLPGEKVFTELFSRNETGDIFNFLDNESSFQQDWRVIGSLPTLPFLKAGLQELIRRD